MDVGFVGLGNMGSVLAGNLVGAGHAVLAHDIAGPTRSPEGATFTSDLGEVARRSDVVVLSLPDGNACTGVAQVLVEVVERRFLHVVDTSTAGIEATDHLDAILAAAGVGLVAAPVSGGIAGAKARTLAVIHSGTPAACTAVRPVLEGLSDVIHRVGDAPTHAQALKLANNFLSATALAAASEAVAFGVAVGLDMGRMLDVLNASSGRSAATADKFPSQVVTERYASGFANTLMDKDVQLYLRAVRQAGTPDELARLTASIWERFAKQEPDVDFTRIYPFVRGRDVG